MSLAPAFARSAPRLAPPAAARRSTCPRRRAAAMSGNAMSPHAPPPPPPPPPSPPGSSTAATAGTADFGTTADELDASVADVLARISALAVADGAPPDDEPAPRAVPRPAGGAPRRVRLVYSDAFLAHRAPGRGGHPERPERLEVIVAALRKDRRLDGLLDWAEPTPVDVGSARRRLVLDLVREVHTSEDYLRELEALSTGGGGLIDEDTYVAAGSYEVALLAVSAWLDAVDHALADGGGGPAWALARPPGHHATRVTGMGFCLLSNAAIAAQYALRQPAVSRVGIIDFDVHHGNGTEHCVKEDERIRFTSSHESPLYPYTGPESFTGPHSTVLNVELPAGTRIDTYRKMFTGRMLPHVLHRGKGQEAPELVIVSAGFDALDVDPLANIELVPADYEELARSIMDAVADAGGHQAVVCGLEGGYNLESGGISSAAVHTARGLAGL